MGSDRWKDPGGPWTGCLNSRNLDGHQQIKLPWYSMVVVGGQGGLWRGHNQVTPAVSARTDVGGVDWLSLNMFDP